MGAHEECFDGTGYPAGLSGEDIPLESRIVACAAAYVKLAQILSGEALAQALEQQSGSALDPEVVTAALAQLARERSASSAPRCATCRAARCLSSAAMAYPLLLSPLRIGPVEIRNRIVSTAHQTTLVEDGLPTDDFVAYHAARAEGGAGLICIEATAVHPSGLLTGHTIAGYDPRVVERLARVADAVHAGGARLFAQLFHGGREQIDSPPRAPAVAPSAVPSQRFKVEPRALSSGEIEEIIAHHELVAGHARAAGLDGIELCASHGYLPTQFLSERSNRRDDAWGGDAERRLRYVREALLAMRRGAGAGLAVGIRLSADESLPEGRHAPETAAILRTLADEGLIDYASAVIGDSASYVGAAWIVPPPPDRARRDARARGRPAQWPAGAADRHLAHSRARRGRGAARGRSGRRRRHDARADRRSRPAETARRRARGRAHPLHRLQPGLHRPLPPRPGDLVPAEPAHGARGAHARGHAPGRLAGARDRRRPCGHGRRCRRRPRRGGRHAREATSALGGQFALAGRAPAHRETAARYGADWSRRLAAAGVEVCLDTRVCRAARRSRPRPIA